MNFPSRQPSTQSIFSRFCVAAAVAIGTLAASASTAALADPPSRVGRITITEGDVSFFSDKNEGWQKARLNFPVTSENSVWTQPRSRAEIRIGSTAVRVGEDAIADFIAVNDERTHVFVQRGTINIRARDYRNDGFQSTLSVETREGRLLIESDGRYRIDASPDGGDTRMMVLAGRARFEGPENTVLIDAGRSLVLSGGNARNYRLDYASEGELDRWAQSRDRQWDDIYARYSRERVISPAMTGYEDLDANGDWVEDREYGRVWAPRVVASDWAPYRHGSWTYVSPWGWTWVDEAPWGFAPFHYGRWVTIGSRWHWWPGRYHHRPAYAPALVAWHGSPGVSVTVGVSGGSLGWFPLAPHEHYVPRYTNNRTYIRNVNYITNNVTVINAPTRYVHGTSGASFVSQSAFLGSQRVQQNLVVQNPTQIAANYRPVPNLEIAPRFNNGGGRGRNGPTPMVAPNPTAIAGAPQNSAYPNQRAAGQTGNGVAAAFGAKPMDVQPPSGGAVPQFRQPYDRAVQAPLQAQGQAQGQTPGQTPTPAFTGGNRGQVPVPAATPVQSPTPVTMAKPGAFPQPGSTPVPNPTQFQSSTPVPMPVPSANGGTAPQPVYNNVPRPQPKPTPAPQVQPVTPSPPVAPSTQVGGAPQPLYTQPQNTGPRVQTAAPIPRFERSPTPFQPPQPMPQQTQIPQPQMQQQQIQQQQQQMQQQARQQQREARQQQRVEQQDRQQPPQQARQPQPQQQPQQQQQPQPRQQPAPQPPAPKPEKAEKPQVDKNDGKGNKP